MPTHPSLFLSYYCFVTKPTAFIILSNYQLILVNHETYISLDYGEEVDTPIHESSSVIDTNFFITCLCISLCMFLHFQSLSFF